MAEINLPAGSGNTPKRRRKILSTKVDLTPMVDLGFLLITFFIFTTKMHESKKMDLVMPADGKPSEWGESGSLTALLLSEDKVFYYHGSLESAMNDGLYGITNYSVKEGIGKVIREKQVQMDNFKEGFRKELMLMVKPTKESVCRNVVDILDEVIINAVPRYALMDITEEELQVLAEKKR